MTKGEHDRVLGRLSLAIRAIDGVEIELLECEIDDNEERAELKDTQRRLAIARVHLVAQRRRLTKIVPTP